MDNNSNNLSIYLIVTVVVLGLWGLSQHNNKNQLEWELSLYQEHLKKYESPKIIQHVIDSANAEYAEEMRNEEKANRTR